MAWDCTSGYQARRKHASRKMLRRPGLADHRSFIPIPWLHIALFNVHPDESAANAFSTVLKPPSTKQPSLRSSPVQSQALSATCARYNRPRFCDPFSFVRPLPPPYYDPDCDIASRNLRLVRLDLHRE
ncbi:hypothetical protein CFIMG_007771RA00001 [Ceratocystis fimbriata CBS 114723]|uniref:Uncharacterized protein n=1 Tax=Ceratocystis fimbriata CBS 114723 TaxID=1035309 RepID=A0A2C5XL03_9PEZI|nr:hypothetical protein CFIMG_007771RA00001 [Ceratocystis fimbriata CBS 114723]